MILFNRINITRHRPSNPIKEALKANKKIKNTNSIVEQLKKGEKIICVVYDDNLELFFNNEQSTIYHLVNSIPKIEALSFESANIAKSNSPVFDVGANIGLYSLFYLKNLPKSKIFLFEPDPTLKEFIELNLRNKGNFEIIENAVTESSHSSVSFFLNPASRQTNSTIKEAVDPFVTSHSIENIEVKTISLDHFTVENKITKIGCIKMDIQGGEYNALTGAQRSLKITDVLALEVSFMMPKVFETIEIARKHFSLYQTISEIKMGSDIIFHN